MALHVAQCAQSVLASEQHFIPQDALVSFLAQHLLLAQPVTDLNAPLVRRAALIAGREDEQIAALALDAAAAFPADKLLHDPAFRLADHAVAKEGARSQVVPGLIAKAG